MNKITVKHPDGRPATQEELERIAGIPTLIERATSYWESQRRALFPQLLADFATVESHHIKSHRDELQERVAKQEEQIAKIGERREELEAERDNLWKIAADRHAKIVALQKELDSWIKLADDRGVEAMKKENEQLQAEIKRQALHAQSQSARIIKMAGDIAVKTSEIEALQKESGQGKPKSNPFGAYCNRFGSLYLKVPDVEHGISLHQATLLRQRLQEAIEKAATIMSGEGEP